MQGRGGVVGWGVGGHLRDKRPPQPLGAGSQHRVGHPHWSALPALLRGVCQCQEAAGCGEAGLRRDTYSGSGGSQWPSQGPLGPGSLGPLCSEGGKATEGFCQLWAGAAAEAAVMATECCMERPGGLLRSGRIPGLAALVGIALSKRKCLWGGGKPGQPFLVAPFTLQG